MRIGIDLGGTKIEGIALGPGGAEIARMRVPTPRGNYDATIAAVGDLVAKLEAESGEKGTVGIAMPGAISPATGLIKNANSTWLNGKPLDKDLATALGREVRLANDANCFALSEAVDGAAAGSALVFGVIIGTGVGGGIALNGAPITGPHAIAGEWGHNPLPWPTEQELREAPECYCGRRGCIETWVSGPGLAADHKRRTGENLTAEELAAIGKTETLRLHSDRLARGLASVVNLLDPDAIVLGGGLSNMDHLYTDLPKRLPEYAFSDEINVPILKNKHGDSSGVRGAAWLWPEDA